MIPHGSSQKPCTSAPASSPTLATHVGNPVLIGLAIGLASSAPSDNCTEFTALRSTVAVSSEAAPVNSKLTSADSTGDYEKIQRPSAGKKLDLRLVATHDEYAQARARRSWEDSVAAESSTSLRRDQHHAAIMIRPILGAGSRLPAMPAELAPMLAGGNNLASARRDGRHLY